MNNIYEFAEQGSVISPQLVFYPKIIQENIAKMIQLAGGPERLWPHIKTHKSANVTKMLLNSGIDKVKCATIAEAEMAAEAGVGKLVLAYPLVGPNVERFLTLTKTFPDTECFAIADDTSAVQTLSKAFSKEGMTCPLLMDMDMGQHRTGVDPSLAAKTYALWDSFPGITMRGMHLYDGHRHEEDIALRTAEAEKIDRVILPIQKALEAEGHLCDIMIFGGTPSFPCHEVLTNGYLSPGTCVIQDAGYRRSFPDLPFVPGAAVLTRVVSRPTNDTFTLDLGCKAVATDPPIPRAEIVGFEYAKTVMQNEEHLVLQVPEEHIPDIPAIGTELFALPVHICPTTALYPQVAVVEEGHLTNWWEVTARNRKITI